MQTPPLAMLASSGLQALMDELKSRGYRVVGPVIRDQAIVYDDIASVNDLPAGWTDEQDGGKYRLVRRDDNALFGHAVGPQSWKKFLHPPLQRLWRARRNERGIEVEAEQRLPSALPSSGFAPAICMRSQFRIASSSAAISRTPTTRRGVRTRLSSR